MFCRAVLFGDVCNVQAAHYRVLRVANSGHVAPPPLPPPVPPYPSHTASLARRKRWEMKGVIHWGPFRPPHPPFRRVCGKIAFPKALITLPPRQFTNLLPRYFFHNREYACFFLFSGSWELFYCPLFWGGEMNWMRIGGVCGEYARTASVPPHPRRRVVQMSWKRTGSLICSDFRFRS